MLVWIHGGGNVNGFGFEPNYRGHNLAASGLVVVSITYRLGALGFAAHPWLAAESAPGASGHYGMSDILAALAWIRTHVGAFGGYPENVSLAGESAGGGNIAALLHMRAADGLYRRVIIQSGALGEQRTQARNAALHAGEVLFSGLGAHDAAALREGVDLLIGSNAQERPMYLPSDGDAALQKSLADYASGRELQARAILAGLDPDPRRREPLRLRHGGRLAARGRRRPRDRPRSPRPRRPHRPGEPARRLAVRFPGRRARRPLSPRRRGREQATLDIPMHRHPSNSEPQPQGLAGAAPWRARLLLLSLCAVACSADPTGSIEWIDAPAAPGALAPNLVADARGVWLSWLEPDGAGHAFKLARLEAGAWGPSATLARGERFFANAADVPAVVRGADGALLAHWLEKSGPETYAYDVRLARSTDGGVSWESLGILHDDATPTEHGFVSYVADAQGVRAFWLDGRATQRGADAAMQLRSALIGHTVGPSERLDDRVCDCCQTGAAPSARGPVVVYRDRSQAELRDVAIVRRQGGGWSQPARVHADDWTIRGCPVNGPAVASDGGQQLSVAWFTGAGERPRVQLAFSSDAGARFDAPVVIDAARASGRVGVLLSDAGEAIVSWVALRPGQGEELRIVRVAPDGRRSEALALASAVAGLPRMVRVAQDLVLAWTDAGAEGGLRILTLPIARVPALPSAPAPER